MAKELKLLRPIVKAGGKIARFGMKKSNWILAILAMLGLAGTTALAVDATIKAVKLCETKEVHGKKEVLRTVWRLYIPTVGCFIVTTLSIVGNAHINARRLATVTGLYAMSQTDLKALKEKAKETLGERKETKMEDEIAKERLNKVVPEQQDQIIDTGHGNKLFMEWLTGQLIRTSPEHVEAVAEKMDNQFSKEVDGVVEVSYYLEQFRIPTDCWVARAIWDMAELMQDGNRHFSIDCHEIQWMEVNGQQEMVGIIKPTEPTGI